MTEPITTTHDDSAALTQRSVGLPLSLIHRLDAYTYANRVSKSSIIRDALARHLDVLEAGDGSPCIARAQERRRAQ